MKTDGAGILVEYSLVDLRRIARGLAGPRDSGEHKLAVMALTRLFGPATVSLAVSLLVLATLLVLIRARTTVIQPPSAIVDYISKPMDPPDRKAFDDEILRIVKTAGAEGLPDMPPAPVADPGVVFQGPPSPAVDVPPLPAGLTDEILRKMPPLKTLANDRGDGSKRKKGLEDGGAVRETEDRVLAALRWLKKKQDPDGSWKSASDVDPAAMTGLAALAFLAHGESPQRESEFSVPLEKAIRHLASIQKEDGRFSASSYTHAIVTYAMAEAFGMTRIMELREPMEKGLAFLIRGQQDEGGFDYNYAKGTRFDTSVAGWNIQALKAGKAAGSRNPDLDLALARAAMFLKTQAYAQDGSGFVYSGTPGKPSPAGGRWTMTGVGTLGLQILGHARDAETRQGLLCLADMGCEWPAGAEPKPHFYGWYYVTQAKFHRGETDWDRWNRQFNRTYLARQVLESDGCGYWPLGDHGGAVYATTLATLTLEVYYRFLPTYKVQETAASPGSRDDVDIQVL